MNYQRHYDRLIDKARRRVTPNGYYEKHHIIPRSIGGSDEFNNIVNLTVREHLIAHQLLFIIYRYAHPKLIFAVWAFFQDRNANRHSLRKRRCWLHSWLRRERSIIAAQMLRNEGRARAARINQMNDTKAHPSFSVDCADEDNYSYGKETLRSAAEEDKGSTST